MQIRSITVGAQRKLPHPNIDYAAISGMVNITANVGPSDNLAECIADIQKMADLAVVAHFESLAASMRQQPRPPAPAAKAAEATATMAATLAAKHSKAISSSDLSKEF